MLMMKKQLTTKKKLDGNISTEMSLDTHSTNHCLLQPLVLELNSLLCKCPFQDCWFKFLCSAVIELRKWPFSLELIILFVCDFSTIFIFILALVGVFYPYNRGALFTALVVIYALTSGIAGYTATSFYCQLEGANWVILKT